MGFWDSASQGMDMGVKLGAHAADRAAYKEMKGKELTESTRRFDIENKRATDRFTWESTDRQKKEQYEKAEKSFNAANALFEAGETTGDETQTRMAAKLLADTYNQHWVNGDEMRIIFKGDSANNPKVAQKWNEDPNLKDKDVAVLSKGGGIMPFNDLKEVFKFASANLNMKNFTEGVKKAEASVAAMNNKEEPFTAEDGHKYVKTWEVGPGGIPQAGPVRAYTDVTKQSKGQETLKEAEVVLGRPLSKEEKRVKAGVSKMESPSERIAAEKASKGESTKNALDITSKALDIHRKNLALVLTPFAKPGKDLFDENDELTNDGQTALDAAGKLINKVDNKEPLTSEEKRKVKHAYRAWDMYNKISGAVGGQYGSNKAGNWRQYDQPGAQPTPAQ
jgi:virulence-associated protein VagC